MNFHEKGRAKEGVGQEEKGERRIVCGNFTMTKYHNLVSMVERLF
jgi:hypothetical protein